MKDGLRVLGMLLLSVAIAAGQSGMIVAARMPLSLEHNGIEGELQLRLSKPGASLSVKRNAFLAVVGPRGKMADRADLERPDAKLETLRLRGDDHVTYPVTVDYSIGMGSYNGPLTFFVEVSAGKLRWVEAVDVKTGQSSRISLMRSLKTIWTLTDAPHGRHKEILQAACRPGFGSSEGGFLLSYTRYSFDGKRWIRYERTESGFSEFEDGFPDRALFP